jgi:phospholipase/carboxylesterase
VNQPEELDFVQTLVPGRSTRTLLLLDGTGGNENDLILLGRQLDPDANLLIPRGKVAARTQQLADFIEQASVKYRLNRQNLFAVGYSNGANIAGSLLLVQPQTLAGAMLLGPMVPIVPEPLPDLSGVPVPAISARYDPAGAEVHGSPENAGHGLSGATVEIVRRSAARSYFFCGSAVALGDSTGLAKTLWCVVPGGLGEVSAAAGDSTGLAKTLRCIVSGGLGEVSAAAGDSTGLAKMLCCIVSGGLGEVSAGVGFCSTESGGVWIHLIFSCGMATTLPEICGCKGSISMYSNKYRSRSKTNFPSRLATLSFSDSKRTWVRGASGMPERAYCSPRHLELNSNAVKVPRTNARARMGPFEGLEVVERLCDSAATIPDK